MSVTGDADGAAGQGRRADHRSRRRAVRADRHPRRAAPPRDSPVAGQHIDTSLVDAGPGAVGLGSDGVFLRPAQVPAPLGSAHRMTAPYQAFRCADGYITIGAANDRNFTKLARVLGHPEWTVGRAIRPPPAGSRIATRWRPHRRGDQHRVALRLDRRARNGGRSVRADPRLRRGLRASAGGGARDVRHRAAPNLGRHPHIGTPLEAVGDAPRPDAAARRCWASTPTMCCWPRGTVRMKWNSCAPRA